MSEGYMKCQAYEMISIEMKGRAAPKLCGRASAELQQGF